MIEAVIFDFGGVLVDWNPEHLYRKLIPDEAERRHFLTEICSSAWNYEQDRGRDWDEAIALKVAEFPHHAPLIRAYRERWTEMCGGTINGGVAIHAKLKAAGIPLYGLTNWSGPTFELGERMFPILRDFKYVAVSGRLRMVKPDPEIYLHLLQHCGLQAKNCLFIDDVAKNVDGARAVGLQAVQFTDPEEVTLKLRELGLPL
ncbi:MAG TPA: HAD family phosphatase [Sphingobium sp.]